MTHPRTDIRDKIAERLKIIPKVKIFSGRSIPMFDQDLPAILVYTNNEQIITERWDTDGCGELTRELEIYIEAISSGRENLDNILDNIAEKIENSLEQICVSPASAPDRRRRHHRHAEMLCRKAARGRIYGDSGTGSGNRRGNDRRLLPRTRTG